jgi:hypothetical protein
MWGRDPFAAALQVQVVKAEQHGELTASMFAGVVPAGVVQLESFGKTPVSDVLADERPSEVTATPFSWEAYERGEIDYQREEVERDYSVCDKYTPSLPRISKVQQVRTPK